MTDAQPPAKLALGGDGASAEKDVTRLISLAREKFAAGDHHAVHEALYQAHALARHGNLHRQAAELRQALTILASGAKPKLLKLLKQTPPQKPN